MLADAGSPIWKPLAATWTRSADSEAWTVTARGAFVFAVEVHEPARCVRDGIPQGGDPIGGNKRGVLASWRLSSQASVAQSTAAPGRAGTSHITLDAPPTVSRDQRVVPNGVTATAISTSTVDG